MKVNGKTVFAMLFAVAVASSVDPVAGLLAFLALLAAINPHRVVQIIYALDDGVQRAQRLLEARRAIGNGADADTGEGVTTAHITNNNTAVVTPEPNAATAATAPAASSVTTARIYNNNTAVVTLPPPSRFDPSDPRPSRFAVPLGFDQGGAFRWLDFGSDALHIGLYGTSGCGKDHLLRLWFVSLLRETAVRWAILDGKGDWLTPNLARLPQMLIPPAGGYGEDGQRRIREAIDAVNEEAKRRFGLLLDAGVRSVEEYNQLTDEPLPLLIVLATDIIDVVDETERLLVALVSKARALGIRVIVSMQTPTGKRLEWRMNLSTLIAGALVDGSQDAPALGVRDSKALRFRPSQLPPPPAERGLFVVRHNNEQFVVRSSTLTADFDALINARNNEALLDALLTVPVTTPRINNKDVGVVTTPVPSFADASGRNEDGDSASESAGTGFIPSCPTSVPSETGQNRPILAGLGDFEDGVRESADEIASSESFAKPQTAPNPVPSLSDAPGRNEENLSDTVLTVLAAMQRAGLSRDQARALGARFSNADWARAARMIREGEK